MTRLSEPLQALIDAEQHVVEPTSPAAEHCWERVRADIERGIVADIDVPPPPPPSVRTRSLGPWVALALLGAGAVAGGVQAYRDDTPQAGPRPTDVPTAPTQDVIQPLPVPASSVADSPPPRAPEGVDVPADEVPERAPAPEPVRELPRQRRAIATATAIGDEDTFAAELRLVAKGQSAITSKDYGEALRIADEYKRTYPRGHFAEDGEALRILALCGSESRKGADAGRRFLRTHPRSIHANRIREVCRLAPSEESR